MCTPTTTTRLLIAVWAVPVSNSHFIARYSTANPCKDDIRDPRGGFHELELFRPP